MEGSEPIPRLPRTIDHKEAMATLGVGEERLALIIIKHPGVVHELREISDEVPGLEESDSSAAIKPKQSKRLRGNKRIIKNMKEAIETMGWDAVVEYLKRNAYRMQFPAMVVSALKDREYQEETGGQMLYCEAQQILGLDKEGMVQSASKLGVSMPSRDINNMGESTILHGFFDFHSEEEQMTSNPEVFIQMRERTPDVKGFANLLRANIEALYFNPDKVFALRRTLQGNIEAIEEDIQTEVVNAVSPESPTHLAPVPRQQKGCRRILLSLLVASGVIGGLIHHYHNEIRSWIESRGLGYLIKPFEDLMDRLPQPSQQPQRPQGISPINTNQAVKGKSISPVDSSQILTEKPPTPAKPNVIDQIKSIESKTGTTVLSKLKELYQLRQTLQKEQQAHPEKEKAKALEQVERLIKTLERQSKEREGMVEPYWY